MRCEVIVYREYGPACCGEPYAHVYETQPMCHRHFVMSLNQGYPFRRQYDATAEIENRSRLLFDRIMA